MTYMLAQKKLPKWLRNIIKITASKKIYMYIFVYVYVYIYIYIYKLICIITVEQTN